MGKEDIAEKTKFKYEVDEYGFLPEYRILLLNTSKKIIPNNLIYVGNFAKTIRHFFQKMGCFDIC